MSEREITFTQALNEALREEMSRDEAVFVLGEDVRFATVSGVTQGLLEEFGEERVIDTPISEEAIAGVAIGTAIMGMRPVAEIMFAEFLMLATNQLINNAGDYYARSNGTQRVPLVVRTSHGVGAHGQNLESIFAHIPGLKVVMPSTPRDGKGLLKSAIRDDNPVIFFESRKLYPEKGPVPSEEYLIPLSKADVKREGEDITIIATGLIVPRALNAAEMLSKEGIDAEVVDPRTLKPLDTKTIIKSVRKTGRLLVTHEAWKTCGIGAEIVAKIVENDEAYRSLKAPISRVCTADIPYPGDSLIEFLMPNENNIFEASKKMVKGK